MVAKTIYQYLGGDGFAFMTGTKNFVSMKNGLFMRLARNKTCANRLEITYDEKRGLYNMRFFREAFYARKIQTVEKDVEVLNGVYCDQLQDIFTQVTGLYTHL